MEILVQVGLGPVPFAQRRGSTSYTSARTQGLGRRDIRYTLEVHHPSKALQTIRTLPEVLVSSRRSPARACARAARTTGTVVHVEAFIVISCLFA